MVFRFFRRRKHGVPEQPRAGWYFWVIGLPLLVDAGLLLALLVGIPMVWGTPREVMAAFFPDLFTLLVASAVALAAWGAARTVLTLRWLSQGLLRPPGSPTLNRETGMMQIEIHIKGRMEEQWSEWLAGCRQPF